MADTPILSKSERLNAAIARKAAEPDLSLRTLGLIYGVPISSLGHRLNGRRDAETYHQSRQRLTVLEEASLIRWIEQLYEWGWPPRIPQLERMAKHLMECKGDHEDLGVHWYQSFLNRHPKFKIRYSRALDQSRKDAGNESTFRQWFSLFNATIEKYGIATGDIYNMDEKGVAMGLSDSAKVIIPRCQRAAFEVQPGNREWVSLIECMSGDGFVLPAYIIFAGKQIQQAWGPAFGDLKAMIQVSEKGWTDNEIGVQWLQDMFDPHTESRTIGTHRLLILDGHESHVSAEFVEYAHHHKIIPLCLPPHSTHILQPLDVGIFSPLAKAYKKRVYDISMYGAVSVTKVQFLTLLYEARTEAFTKSNITGAWKGTGLIPFKPAEVIAKLRPITPPAAAKDSDGNDVVVECPSTVAKISKLVGDIKAGQTSGSDVDTLLDQLKEIALTATHEKYIHSKQSQDIIERNKRKRMNTSRKACGEARVLTVESIEVARLAAEAKEAAETAENERKAALYGKGKFAQLVWKELKCSVDIFD